MAKTNGDYWRGIAEQQGLPLRTLKQVKAELAADERRDPEIAKAMARLMLRHGRLTDESREYIAGKYPQD